MITSDRIIPFRATRERPSPNQGSRKGAIVSLIILHATADQGNELGAEDWMCSPKSKASAHLHIRRDGSVTRLVPDAMRAWHAGISYWPSIADVNSESLGWEIANRNDGREPYTDAQYSTVAKLLRHYMPQGILRGDVLSHANVSPGRKTDPLGWDWSRMWREAGNATSPHRPVLRRGVSGPAVLELQRALGVTTSGYFGSETQDAVKALQRGHGLADDGIVGPLTWAKVP